MEETVLHETFEGSAFAEATISGSVIHNVKLLGEISKNKRTYSEKSLNDAVALYENVGFYFDHPTKRELRERGGSRKVMDLAGKVRNARRQGKEVRGDVQLLDFKESNAAPFVKALAEQMPEMAGFSHRAAGKITKGKDGANDVVESLSHVFAQELVTDPATTSGLFESLEHPDDPTGENEMEIKDLTLEGLRKDRPDLVRSIETEIAEGAEMKALKADNVRMKDEAELREKEDKKTAHKALVQKKLTDSKLHEDVITETFRGQLNEAKDEKVIDALIDDRKELAEKRKKSGPRSTETNMDEALRTQGEFEKVTDDHLEEAMALFN